MPVAHFPKCKKNWDSCKFVKRFLCAKQYKKYTAGKNSNKGFFPAFILGGEKCFFSLQCLYLGLLTC